MFGLCDNGGKDGIRTHAPCYRPNPLAGGPLNHLGTSPNCLSIKFINLNAIYIIKIKLKSQWFFQLISTFANFFAFKTFFNYILILAITFWYIKSFWIKLKFYFPKNLIFYLYWKISIFKLILHRSK